MTSSLKKANSRLDAATILVGYTNRSATRGSEKTLLSNETVRLNTKLDAAALFSLICSHPGHSEAVTVTLEFAPLLNDGSTGSFVTAATVSIPAAGGRVETYINGHELTIAPADAPNVTLPCIAFARAVVAPATPAGMIVGLTATMAA